MSMVIDKTVVDRFFDRARVQAIVKRKHLRVLSKAGAFVRTRARSKLRPRKRSALPGQPPSVHSTGFMSLRNVLFALHRDNESVVIGPRFVKRLKRSNKQTGPELQEEGGTAEVTLTQIGDQWLPGNLHPKAPKKKVMAQYAPHPFMGPALKEEAAKGTLGGLYLYG
jgi:hypothetical protein